MKHFFCSPSNSLSIAPTLRVAAFSSLTVLTAILSGSPIAWKREFFFTITDLATGTAMTEKVMTQTLEYFDSSFSVDTIEH